ncbi:MAG: DUF1488 family protein [Aquincola tertiaricarbonis]|uniref:DUF1488 family protein n=1 Tax=Aquincola TaxID=391952 RepID=UPI000614A96F|nr:MULTISPECIES: DUF1488 family protein [Aquincola]MCR5867929.1 DUF1488 domain-containing protein [Aquincola sp. J276]
MNTNPPFFDPASATVRFWVTQEGQPPVAASIGGATLRYHFQAQGAGDDLVAAYVAHARQIDEAVRRRLAAGSREPVMLRDPDVAAAR